MQVDRAGSYAPDSGVTGRLQSVLRQETSKSVVLADGDVLDGRSCWSDGDVADAEAQHRHVHTAGPTVTLYVLFLDGTYCPNSDVIGFAFGASAMFIFGAASQELSSNPTNADLFTEAVEIHELGHVFGLVNIGYHSTIDHEDRAYPHHSSNQMSVMFHEIDQRHFLRQFISGPPQNYDANDENDLRGLATGRY